MITIPLYLDEPSTESQPLYGFHSFRAVKRPQTPFSFLMELHTPHHGCFLMNSKSQDPSSSNAYGVRHARISSLELLFIQVAWSLQENFEPALANLLSPFFARMKSRKPFTLGWE
jgi:hypothetical protein